MLPGVQVLFAFLLAVPFSQRFAQATDLQKDAYMVALLCTVGGTVFLIAPATFHRIRFRDRDKEQLLFISNRFAIAGTVFLAAAMTAAVFLVTDLLFHGRHDVDHGARRLPVRGRLVRAPARAEGED